MEAERTLEVYRNVLSYYCHHPGGGVGGTQTKEPAEILPFCLSHGWAVVGLTQTCLWPPPVTATCVAQDNSGVNAGHHFFLTETKSASGNATLLLASWVKLALGTVSLSKANGII